MIITIGSPDTECDSWGRQEVSDVTSVTVAHTVPWPSHTNTGGQAALPPGGEEFHVRIPLYEVTVKEDSLKHQYYAGKVQF